MKYLLLIFLSIGIFLSSCNEDEPSIELSDEPLVTLQGLPTSLPFENFYLIATDLENNILDYLEVDSTQEVHQIFKPVGFDDPRFNWHMLVIYTEDVLAEGSYVMLSYLNSEQTNRDYTNPLPNYNYGNSINIKYSFVEIPVHSSYKICVGNRTIEEGNQLEEGVEYKALIRDNNDSFFIILEHNGTRSYKYINNLSSSDTHELSLKNMQDEIGNFSFTVPANYNISTIYFRGYYDQVDPLSGQAHLLDYTATNGSDIYYPINSTDFHHFSLSTSLTIAGVNKRINYVEMGMPTEMKSFDLDVKAPNMSNGIIEFDAEGSYDYYFVETSYSSAEAPFPYRRWAFYGAGNTQEYFPDIPEEILEKYPQVEAESLENGFLHLSCKDYQHLQDYDDFLDRIDTRRSVTDGFTHSVEVTASNY